MFNYGRKLKIAKVNTIKNSVFLGNTSDTKDHKM